MTQTPADQLRAAADKLAPESTNIPDLTVEYPDVDAAYAHLLRNIAETADAVMRHCPEALDENAHWIAPALAVARQLLGTTDGAPKCGKTISIDGKTHPPCALDADHPEAYCRDSSGNEYFIATHDTRQVRAAAEKLRKLIAAVACDITANPYWGSDEYPPHDYPNLYARGVDNAMGGPAGSFAVTMHPGVGLALAALLESVAARHVPRREAAGLSGGYTTGCRECGGDDWPCPDLTPALAVARQVLGTTGEQHAVAQPAPAADRTALRDRIAKVLAGTELKPPFPHCLAAADAVLAVLPAPADRAAILREAATLLVDHASTLEALSTSDYDKELFAASHLRTKAVDLHRLAARVQQPAVPQPEPTVAGELTAADRKFLTFALDLAADQMLTRDGFTDNDEAALATLRRLTTTEGPTS